MQETYYIIVALLIAAGGMIAACFWQAHKLSQELEEAYRQVLRYNAAIEKIEKIRAARAARTA